MRLTYSSAGSPPRDAFAAPAGRFAQEQLVEFDAELAQKLLPAWALRRKIDRGALGENEELTHSRWYGWPRSKLAAR